MKILVVGDAHGNVSWLCDEVVPFAVKSGVCRIVQVGDFGLVWRGRNSPRRLVNLCRVLRSAGLSLTFLPGNHEDHPELERVAARAPRSPEGHAEIFPGVFYTGRVSSWEWEGRRLAAVGGGVSVDRGWRQARARRGGSVIWWPEEVLSEEERADAALLGPVEVLFSHDAPSAFPSDGLSVDLESTAYRQAMTDIGRALCPRLWFHGHYHRSVAYPFYHDGGMCEVVSLDRDGSSLAESTEILTLS